MCSQNHYRVKNSEKMRAQFINCTMEYIDEEESPTKKLKTLIDQASQQDSIQTAQECVKQYPRSKLGTRRVVNKGILRGIDRRRTEMKTQ